MERFSQIDSEVEDLRLPSDGRELDQDEEWCEVVVSGKRRRIRFHDYDEIYRIPGLYERLFYQRLRCCSPSRVVRLLEGVLADFDEDISDLRVLDLGAGNGMVGDELDAREVDAVVGVDIHPEAREAARRDRPGVYDDYVVTDLAKPSPVQRKVLRPGRFNCLTCVAALGYGDIPPRAFLHAFDLLEVPGWVAFNIKESFLKERDETGFSRSIRELVRQEVLQVQAYWRFRHRLSVAGEPLYYIAMIARKLRELPRELGPIAWIETDGDGA
jgi:SAM-dependent methyltransferase